MSAITVEEIAAIRTKLSELEHDIFQLHIKDRTFADFEAANAVRDLGVALGSLGHGFKGIDEEVIAKIMVRSSGR